MSHRPVGRGPRRAAPILGLFLGQTLALAFAFSAAGGWSPADPTSPSSAKTTSKKVAGSSESQAAKKGTLYVIGYSHLDTQWCWTYPQVIREFIPNTLNDNFRLFKKYPDYVFNWTGSNRYVFMKEYYPQQYATLKKYVKEGRWFPAGSCIEEGDVNSPSVESLVRQVLYANDFFRKEFGTASSEFMLPDCFGFPADLPSALAFSGLKGFSTQKLTWGSAVGIPFNVGEWIGLDGQRITAALDPTAYTSIIDDNLANDPYWVKRLQGDIDRSGVGVDYRYYGTGDRGGAPNEDSVANLMKSIHTDGQIKVVGGAADTMFNELTEAQKDALPKYQGDLELMQHSTGSLSSEGAMKRWNRKNELIGESAEKASAAADWLGSQPYPMARLTDAWLRFLPGQFHDLMAGTALPLAYTYTWNDELIAMNEFADVLKHSTAAVTKAMDTEPTHPGGVAVSVYNPLSIRRQDIVDAEVTFPGDAPADVAVYGPDGKAVPSQVDGRDGSKVHVVFLATVPPVGYASYTVASGSKQGESDTLSVTDRTLENGRYKVTVNEAGDVASIFDKKLNKDLLSGPARLEYQYENPSQYPAWNMDWDDQNKPPRGYVGGPASFKIVENGPVRVGLEVTRHSDGSVFHQTIELASGAADSQVTFKTQIDWKGKECALKAAFPLSAENDDASYNLGYGVIERPTNYPKLYEDLHHQWFDLTDKSGQWGTTILDDCKYGSDKPDGHTLRLTLLYTPGVRAGYQHQATQDWGRNVVTYAIEGHSGDWRTGDAQWQGKRLNQPLVGFQVPSHPGKAGRDLSFARLNTDQVSLEVIKKAERTDALVVHLSELEGESAKNVRLSFHAPIESVKEVNGQEFPITATGPMKLVDGDLVFDMTKYRPRAFEIRLARPTTPMRAPVSHPLDLPWNADVVSSWPKPTEGNFDGKGDSIPGEMLPKSIDSAGVKFRFANTADGASNAVACKGQTIALPSGKGRTLLILAADGGKGKTAAFRAGDHTVDLSIRSWTAKAGEWDTRLWGGKVPELAYDWHNPIVGLVPGHISHVPIAWYSNHYRTAKGENAIYDFCSLYRYQIRIPDGANSVTLPDAPSIKIMAATVASNLNDEATPVQPLYDVIRGRSNETGPTMSPSGGTYNDAARVTINPPLYWSPSTSIHYTLDGSTPTLQSPTASGSIVLDRSCTVKAAQFDASGKFGPVTSASFSIDDRTQPRLVKSVVFEGGRKIQLYFSKPVERSHAESTASYRLDPASGGTANRVTSVDLSADGEKATLNLAEPFAGPATLTIDGVTDTSPNTNPLDSSPRAITSLAPVFSDSRTRTFSGAAGQAVESHEPSLPTRAGDHWTLSMWVKYDQLQDGLSVVGGFGSGRDDAGAERFLASFEGHPHFWGSSIDVDSPNTFKVGQWELITITYDGSEVRLYEDGKLTASQEAGLSDAKPTLRIAPKSPWDYGHAFKGQIADMTVWSEALPAELIQSIAASRKPQG